jgi:hypothetical protein
MEPDWIQLAKWRFELWHESLGQNTYPHQQCTFVDAGDSIEIEYPNNNGLVNNYIRMKFNKKDLPDVSRKGEMKFALDCLRLKNELAAINEQMDGLERTLSELCVRKTLAEERLRDRIRLFGMLGG